MLIKLVANLAGYTGAPGEAEKYARNKDDKIWKRKVTDWNLLIGVYAGRRR